MNVTRKEIEFTPDADGVITLVDTDLLAVAGGAGHEAPASASKTGNGGTGKTGEGGTG